MYFTENDKHTIDNCRFCFMCRHVCPVGMVTGSEANNARARAELISLVNRGFAYTPDIAEVVYECALCGACTTQCCTGFDPLPFTKHARMEALAAEQGSQLDALSRQQLLALWEKAKSDGQNA